MPGKALFCFFGKCHTVRVVAGKIFTSGRCGRAQGTGVDTAGAVLLLPLAPVFPVIPFAVKMPEKFVEVGFCKRAIGKF